MKDLRWRHLLGAAVIAFAGSTIAQAGEHLTSEHVHVMDPWSRELPPVSANGAVYLTLMNKGKKDGRVVGGSSPIASRAEVHNHVMQGGIMKMMRVEGGVVVPAGGAVSFAPGGLHIMLMELKEPLQTGKVFPITLEFADGGTATVDVSVLSMAQAAKKGKSMDHAGHGDMKPMNKSHGMDKAHEKTMGKAHKHGSGG